MRSESERERAVVSQHLMHAVSPNSCGVSASTLPALGGVGEPGRRPGLEAPKNAVQRNKGLTAACRCHEVNAALKTLLQHLVLMRRELIEDRP